jgi:hypothetical protein
VSKIVNLSCLGNVADGIVLNQDKLVGLACLRLVHTNRQKMDPFFPPSDFSCIRPIFWPIFGKKSDGKMGKFLSVRQKKSDGCKKRIRFFACSCERGFNHILVLHCFVTLLLFPLKIHLTTPTTFSAYLNLKQF